MKYFPNIDNIYLAKIKISQKIYSSNLLFKIHNLPVKVIFYNMNDKRVLKFTFFNLSEQIQYFQA